jgi:hypothetical protein
MKSNDQDWVVIAFYASQRCQTDAFAMTSSVIDTLLLL